jgi:hypothetical protein
MTDYNDIASPGAEQGAMSVAVGRIWDSASVIDHARTSQSHWPAMAWTKPLFTREKANVAARALVAYDALPNFDVDAYAAYERALPIINNWRSSHGFPLNTFRVNLNRAARKLDPECLLAQRIKRLSSISAKLQRFPDMKFSQMQDVGGCRAVMRSVDHVYGLVDAYKKSQIKHRLVHIDDYIKEPPQSGYRGVHLVYRYFSDKSEDYNDLKIEMQLRSTYQHAWATAVETVGTFLQQALKSSLGQEDWLRFFILMGTAIAFKEGTPPVPGTPNSYEELLPDLYQYSVKLDVENRLRAFMRAMQVLKQPDWERAAYFLLAIDPKNEKVTVRGFKRSEIGIASAAYLEEEKKISKDKDTDAVLVSVDSAASLERAYPNYFADTNVFLVLLQEAVDYYEREFISSE